MEQNNLTMTTSEKVKSIRASIKKKHGSGEHTHQKLCEMIGISPKTFYKRRKDDSWTTIEKLAVDNLYSKLVVDI